MVETEECPLCGGLMTRTTVVGPIELGARSVEFEHEMLQCGDCGEGLYEPGEIDALQLRVAAKVRDEYGLMQPAEIVALRGRWKLSQSAFERLLGVGPKTVVRWEGGRVCPNQATDWLLRILRDVPGVAEYLSAANGVPIGFADAKPSSSRISAGAKPSGRAPSRPAAKSAKSANRLHR